MTSGADVPPPAGAQAPGSAIAARFWLFCLTGASLPLFAFAPLSVAGRPVDLATSFAGLFVVASLPTLVAHGRRPLVVWLAGAALVPLLVLGSGAAGAPAFRPLQFGLTYLHWLLVIGFFFAAAHLEMTRSRWATFVRVQVAAGLVVTSYGFYQLVGRPLSWPGTGYVISSFQRQPFVASSFGGYERPTSVFLEPSYLGSYLAWLAILPLSMALIRPGVTSWGRARHGLAFSVLVLGVVSTVSLGAYVDLAVICGLLCVLVPRKLRGAGGGRALLVGAGVVSAGIVAGILAGDALGHSPQRAFLVRMEELVTQYRSGRIEELGTHRAGLHLRELRVAATRPVAGIGLGQYKAVSPTLAGPYVGTREIVSGWLGAAAEMGVCGLVVLLSALALARGRGGSIEAVLLLGFALVNQLHAAGFVELTFWYPLSVCAVVSRLGCADGEDRRTVREAGREVSTAYRRWGKRALDVCLASAGLLLLSPVLLAAAICVGLVLGRPVLLRQERSGRRGSAFRILKFRTMSNERGADGELLPDADRLGRFGRFLRAASIDELPELWNVLAGEMSLVGPRPLLVDYLPLYTERQARRHEVRPGISGWAQVNGRNDMTWERRFELDVWYVENCSLLLDLGILLATLRGVFLREGISAGGHATMPRFTGSRDNR